MKAFKLAILSLFISFGSTAQDYHLSMYDAAPLYLNPALTGVFDGNWRVHGHYRTQWRSVNFKPYTTALVSLDRSIEKWGFGGQIINYRAGYGNYNVLQGLFSASYTVPIDVEKKHNLSIGLQGGVSQKSVRLNFHTYNNQYTTANGGGFNNGLPNGEAFDQPSFLIPELNAGLMYYYAAQKSRLNPFVGVSAFNLLTPEEAFFINAGNELPMRYYAHVGTRINITETFYFIPKVLYMQQRDFQEITFAADAGYFLKTPELFLLGGLVYRNKDAFILSLGARKENYIAKVAYDINTSSLTPASTGRGGFEVSFTYIFRDPDKVTDKVCPRL
jgi:type IX secretion system PorP/SprF family membrane protein